MKSETQIFNERVEIQKKNHMQAIVWYLNE